MAQIHAASFTTPRPWSAAEFAALADAPGAFLCLTEAGFLWGRTILDEAELLTVAVDPAARGNGQGADLVAQFLAVAAARGATHGFLEVADGNRTARHLYDKAGFAEIGRRKRYYVHPDGSAEDAVLLGRAVP